MSYFLVFIPGVRGANNEHLDRVGLADLRRDRNPLWRETMPDSPGETGGMYAYWSPVGDPEPGSITWEWHLGPGDPDKDIEPGKYFIGLPVERRPGPHDLQRCRLADGAAVTLLDGNEWVMPIPRQLPHRCGVDPEDGSFTRRIAPGYEEYWDRHVEFVFNILSELETKELVDAFARLHSKVTPPTVQIELRVPDAWDFVMFGLSINYRVVPFICDILGLFDDHAVVAAVCAAIELPLLRAVATEKKTDCPSPLGIPVG
jgi:hypothetical protein